MSQTTLTRRGFLRLAALSLGSLAVAACGTTATATPVATATPAAAPATPTAAPMAAPTATHVAPAPAASGQALELNFWGGWTGPDGGVMSQLVDKYNASQSAIHVTLMTQQWTPLFDKFVVSVRSKTVPDILAMHGPDIPQFAAQNVLQPLDTVVKSAGFSAGDFAAPAWNGTIYNGTQYAFPLDLHMHAIYYNSDMLAKANITAPTDFVQKDDFVKMVTALTLDKNGKHPGDSGFDANNVQQYGLGMYSNHHGFYNFYALLRQQGDNFLTSDYSQVSYPEADGIAAWKWLQDLVFTYKASPAGESNPLQDFLGGKTALLDDGPWEIPSLVAQTGFHWGSFPWPQVFANRAMWGSGHVLTIPVQSDAARQEAAEKVVTWIIQNSAAWGNSGNIPALTSARQSPTFTALPGREGFVQSLPYEVMLPAIPAEAQVFSAAATSPIVVASQQILVQDMPIGPAMDAMNTAINALLKSS